MEPSSCQVEARGLWGVLEVSFRSIIVVVLGEAGSPWSQRMCWIWRETGPGLNAGFYASASFGQLLGRQIPQPHLWGAGVGPRDLRLSYQAPVILAGSQEWDRLSRTAPLTPPPD